jgi:hypothetical protein
MIFELISETTLSNEVITVRNLIDHLLKSLSFNLKVNVK